MSARTVSAPVAVLVVVAAGAVGWVAPARGAGHVAAAPPAPVTADEARALLAVPLECPHGVGVVLDRALATPSELDDPSAQVVAARCDAGAGNPPSGVYLVGRRAGLARVAATLVGPQDDLVQPAVSVRGQTVTVAASGFGSPDVARCCPDLRVVRTWQVRHGALEPVSG